MEPDCHHPWTYAVYHTAAGKARNFTVNFERGSGKHGCLSKQHDPGADLAAFAEQRFGAGSAALHRPDSVFGVFAVRAEPSFVKAYELGPRIRSGTDAAHEAKILSAVKRDPVRRERDGKGTGISGFCCRLRRSRCSDL